MSLLLAGSALGVAAHGVHYALVGGGILGLGGLLGPQWLERRAPSAAPRDEIADEHDARVASLRAQLAGTATATATGAATRAATGRTPGRRLPLVARRTLPIAVVSSAAAAGVHAAVIPAHLGEGVLVTLFFAVVGIAQAAWAALALGGVSRRLLAAGVIGNLAVLTVWAASRTVGVPDLGLLPALAVEPLGAWDLACAFWEVATIAICLSLLSRPGSLARTGRRLAPLRDWDRPARRWLTLSVVALALLTIGGGHA